MTWRRHALTPEKSALLTFPSRLSTRLASLTFPALVSVGIEQHQRLPDESRQALQYGQGVAIPLAVLTPSALFDKVLTILELATVPPSSSYWGIDHSWAVYMIRNTSLLSRLSKNLADDNGATRTSLEWPLVDSYQGRPDTRIGCVLTMHHFTDVCCDSDLFFPDTFLS
jgi:hypothetical protein